MQVSVGSTRQHHQSRLMGARTRSRIARGVKLLGIILSLAGLCSALRHLRQPLALSSPRKAFQDEHLVSSPLSRCVPRKGDGIGSIDPCSRPHVPVSAPAPPFPHPSQPISLSEHCLDQWLAHGVVQCTGTDAVPEPKLDVVWTWVNGSDPRWREAMISSSRDEGIYSPEFHFR